MAAQQDQSAEPMTQAHALFDRAAPSHWRRLFALTFGQMKTCTELAGQRIAPLIGAFLVGDVLQKKQERSVVGLA